MHGLSIWLVPSARQGVSTYLMEQLPGPEDHQPPWQRLHITHRSRALARVVAILGADVASQLATVLGQPPLVRVATGAGGDNGMAKM
eukprot:COSAG01_NODE_10770_length_2083_cov_171.070060_4_plen_87_part_00